MKYSKWLAGILAAFVLASCGPASKYVKVKINTPIGMGKKFHHLSSDFFSLHMNPAYCLQNQLFVGTNDGVDSNQLINQRISLVSEIGPCSAGSIVACLQNYSFLDPIEMQIVKGQEVDVGLMGAFYLPADTDSDGICDASNGTDAVVNFSISGHEKVNIAEPETINLNNWVIDSYLAAAPSSYICLGNHCANQDLVHILTSKQNYLKVTSVDYFFDFNTYDHVEHYLFKNLGAVAANFYVPHMFPMMITYDCSYDSSTGNVVWIDAPSNTAVTIASCGVESLQINSL